MSMKRTAGLNGGLTLAVVAWLASTAQVAMGRQVPSSPDRGRRAAQEASSLPEQSNAPDTGALIFALQADADPAVRARAAHALTSMGTPPAVRALRTSLTEDPDPEVRVAAAQALGALGPMARSAIPELVRALTPTGDDGTVCGAAAEALGSLGRWATEAVRPLAGAAASGCGGNPDAPLAALSLIARDVARRSETLSREELQGFLAEFEEAERESGIRVPKEVRDSLTRIQGTIRARSPDWIGEGVALLAPLFGMVFSALRSVGGMAVALLIAGLVLLGLRNLKRFLPGDEPGAGNPSPARWSWREVEIWLKRPEGVWGAGHPGPDSMISYLREKAGRDGVSLEMGDVVLEDHWEAFARTAAGGSIPSYAASRWVEATLASEAEGGETRPPGSILDVTLAEIDGRYVPGPEAPPKEYVSRTIQAVAWETLKTGSLNGWVRTRDLGSMGSEAELDIILDYAANEMGLLKAEPRKGRVQLTTDGEMNARLGGLHLLRSGSVSGPEVLGQIATLQEAAVNSVGRERAPAFLRTVAQALLDAAAGLEEDAPDLGIAEEALAELAESRQARSGGAGPDPGVPDAPSTGSGMVGFRGQSESTRTRLKRLQSRLRSEKHSTVRERIYRAIGEIGPPARPALPLLMDAVERDPVGAAVAAVDAMGRIGPDAGRAVPLLMEHLETGNPDLRLAATRALGRMGPSAAAAAPVLMRWTSEGGVPHELQARAVEALGGMPEEAVVSIPTLTDLLRSPVAMEVRAAAALALGRIDPGRREVREALLWAQGTQDPALRGMAGVALLVRERRLSLLGGSGLSDPARSWALPMLVGAGILTLLEIGALLVTQLVTPGTLLPTLFLTPVLAFLAGVSYAVATRRLRRHPALGGGVTGWAGASAGLLVGLAVSAAVTPVAVLVGGCLALGSGAFGGTLVRTALAEI